MNRFRSLVAFATLSIVALALSLPAPVTSQQAPLTPGEECGSNVTPQEAQRYLQMIADGIPQAPFAVDPPYCVPIAGHIVRSSQGTGGLSITRYQQAIQNANNAYANTGIVFYSLGVDYIDDDTYFIDVNNAELTTLRQINVIPAAINVYFAPNPIGLCGISSFTFSSVQGIIQNNSCTAVPTNSSTFAHEIGHYFDLFHTHETAFGAELVNGSNCGFAGDRLCDTPADPRLSGLVNTACQYTGTATDANGDPYTPDTHQYMSYARSTCRNVFSPLSEAKAVQTLLNLRPELLSRGCSPQGNATVAQIEPPVAFVDQTLDVIIVGANLGVFTSVIFGDGITVNVTDSISNDSLLVNITVDENAVLGDRDVIVNNDFVPDTLEAGFAITPTFYHYVSANGSNTYPYARPEDAAPSLADVLAAASTGDSVFVDTLTLTNISASVTEGITVSGGWMNNFTARNLSFKRTALELTNNVFLGATPDPIVFDGFELRNGNGTQDIAPFTARFGGGVRIVDGDVTVSNCVFMSCRAAPGTNFGVGGGISADNSTVTISGNTFTGNHATQGGAIYLYECDGAVTANTVSNNTIGVGGMEDLMGAGVALENCTNVSLSDNTLDSNTGAEHGGGYALAYSTGVTVDGGAVSNNTASFSGGGAFVRHSTATFSGVRFEANSSSVIGGAMAADTSNTTASECDFVANTAIIGAGPYVNRGEAYFRHNTIVGNVAANTGGGLYVSELSAGSIDGNTIDGNAASPGIGGLFAVNSPIEVFNNIVTNSIGHGFGCNGALPSNTHNLVWNSSGDDYDGCSPGMGAVSGDPLFVDTATEDFRLSLNSPAIDSGRPGAPYDDPDGSRGDLGRYGSHAFVMAQPVFPKNLVAGVNGGDVILSWMPNPEGDIDFYAVYCDTVSGFLPGPGNLVTTTPDSLVNLGAPADTAYYRISAVDTDGYAGGYSAEVSSEPVIATGIGEQARYRTSLGQNVPNPFNPTTTIRFTLSKRQPIQLVVYDVAGRRIRTLANDSRGPGPDAVSWDGRSDTGAQVASGVYFYRLEAGAFVQTRKMLLLK